MDSTVDMPPFIRLPELWTSCCDGRAQRVCLWTVVDGNVATQFRYSSSHALPPVFIDLAVFEGDEFATYPTTENSAEQGRHLHQPMPSRRRTFSLSSASIASFSFWVSSTTLERSCSLLTSSASSSQAWADFSGSMGLENSFGTAKGRDFDSQTY